MMGNHWSIVGKNNLQIYYPFFPNNQKALISTRKKEYIREYISSCLCQTIILMHDLNYSLNLMYTYTVYFKVKKPTHMQNIRYKFRWMNFNIYAKKYNCKNHKQLFYSFTFHFNQLFHSQFNSWIFFIHILK